MKNQFKLIGLAVLFTAIVFSFAACKNNTTPTPTPLTDPALNGTWLWLEDGLEGGYKFNNGTYELSNARPFFKGTFTTSAGSMTLTPTHAWGISWSLEAQWYTKAEIIAAYPAFEETVNSTFAEYSGTYTYSISGNTLTLTEEGYSPMTLTKQP